MKFTGVFETLAPKKFFDSSASPISSDFIIGDGNCGYRSIAHLLTGKSK